MPSEPLISKHTRTYNSITGVECEVTMAGRQIGTLQGISYTVTREKGPNYAMGSANPRTFSRGNSFCRVTGLKSGKASPV